MPSPVPNRGPNPTPNARLLADCKEIAAAASSNLQDPECMKSACEVLGRFVGHPRDSFSGSISPATLRTLTELERDDLRTNLFTLWDTAARSANGKNSWGSEDPPMVRSAVTLKTHMSDFVYRVMPLLEGEIIVPLIAQAVGSDNVFLVRSVLDATKECYNPDNSEAFRRLHRPYFACFTAHGDPEIRGAIAHQLMYAHTVRAEMNKVFVAALSDLSRVPGEHAHADRMAGNIWIGSRSDGNYPISECFEIARQLLAITLHPQLVNWTVAQECAQAAKSLISDHTILPEELIQSSRELVKRAAPSQCRISAVEIVIKSENGELSERVQDLGGDIRASIRAEDPTEVQLGGLTVLEHLFKYRGASKVFPAILAEYEDLIAPNSQFEVRCFAMKLIAGYGDERQRKLVRDFFLSPALLIRLPLSPDPQVCRQNGELITKALTDLYAAGASSARER